MRPRASVFFRNADFGADFRRGIDAARFRQGHFVHRVGHHLRRFLQGIELDGAGLRVHVRQVVLVGAVVLAGGDQHGILHRVQDDLRIDALFLAQYLDGLKNRFQSALFVSDRILWQCVSPVGLPLELQIGLLDLL